MNFSRDPSLNHDSGLFLKGFFHGFSIMGPGNSPLTHSKSENTKGPIKAVTPADTTNSNKREEEKWTR